MAELNVAEPPGVTTPCLACGSRPRLRRIAGSQMLVCPRCGMGQVVTDGPPRDYWAREHDRQRDGAESYWTDARSSLFGGALHLLASETQGRRLLDVGGGVGHFAACALGAGWDAYSLDVSQVAVDAAAARIGSDRSLQALPGDLAGTFDAVTLWCVVAHAVDPLGVLGSALQALRPGGTLFLTTPNFRFQIGYVRVLARLGRPVDFGAHDHLLHFTPDSLTRVLAGVGVTGVRFCHVGVTEHCVADERLRFLVPAKRAWNRAAAQAARWGLPLLTSELQAVGTLG